MFKAFGNFIHRTPWWALILLGFSVLLLTVAFSMPRHILRLSDSGTTPAERNAIKREIDRAALDSALGLAENIVTAIKERSQDEARRQEMQMALDEIHQARKDILSAEHDVHSAQREVSEAAKEAMKDASEAAFEAAATAAEAALEAARDSREAIEEAKKAAEEQLRKTGVDSTAALGEFDRMISLAREKEIGAEEAIRKIKKAKKRGISFGVGADGIRIETEKDGKPGIAVFAPTAPAAPNAPAAPPATSDKKSGKSKTTNEGVNFDGTIAGKRVTGNINLDPPDVEAPPAPPSPAIQILPPTTRSNIREVVASDVRRVGVGSMLVLLFIPMFIMTLIAKYFIDRSRGAQAFAEQKKQEADVSNVNRQITEARLQALQAQVEPHFLYNTLANVQALTEVDPAQANQMTGHLIQYLRSSLPKMRENTSTIGQEVELVRAYLNILKMRMGPRLEFGIECAEDLLRTAFPPMMLPSLVENAIKHGLEPQREGGRIDVIVTPITTAEGKRIRVTVRDTGRGLTDAPVQAGGGVGLSNIRERLQALYGDGGKLTLESNEPRGVIASIEVPAEIGGTRAAIATGSTMSNGSNKAATPTPEGWWGKTSHAISATHGVWAKIMSKTFIVLMIVLAVLFGLAFAALITGVLPLNFGDTEIGGVEGMALGSLVLLAGFGVVALAILIVVGLLYGIGLLVGGLLLIVPLIILIASFPALAPFILVGLVAYWFFFKRPQQKSTDERST